MNDDIIRMARKAGFFPDWNWDRTNWHAAGFSESFERLVELVRADERARCADLCDQLSDSSRDLRFGAAIRARGQA